MTGSHTASPTWCAGTEPEPEVGEERRAMDPWLFFAAMALACLGLVMVYSAGVYTARVRYPTGSSSSSARGCSSRSARR